jgi:hypothetical protein
MYVVNFGNYEGTYGAIGGIIVLLLWFYLTGLVIVIGAEMNAEIEHASPYGKEPGEKVPGQKRAIGSAAMRAWVAKRRGEGDKPPSADEVKKVTKEQPAAAAAMRAHEAPGRHRRPTAGVELLLGVGVAVAQFWMTLKALRKTRA